MQLLGIVAAAPNGLHDYSVHPKESEFAIGPVVAIKTTFKLFYLAEVLLFPHTSLVNSNDDYLFQKIASWAIERMAAIIPN